MSPDGTAEFSWPDGIEAAVSVSFDDARLTQIDRCIPILNDHGVRGSFYVTWETAEPRLDDWLAAVEAGHEIGNHTMRHPCTANFAFAGDNCLEKYTLEKMDRDIQEATDVLQQKLHITPTTFAYPCGQKFVGVGENCRSYVPLVARHFVVGRGFRDEADNNPLVCDLAQASGTDFDNTPFEKLKARMDSARVRGGWLIFAGHEVGDDGGQTVYADALEELCRYAADNSNGLWLDTVDSVGRHIATARGEL